VKQAAKGLQITDAAEEHIRIAQGMDCNLVRCRRKIPTPLIFSLSLRHLIMGVRGKRDPRGLRF
jgi:hypothetical protein